MNAVYTLEKTERKYDTMRFIIRYSTKHIIYKNIFIIYSLHTHIHAYIYTHISKEHLKILTYSVTVPAFKKQQFLSTDTCAETTQMLKDILENKNTHFLIHTGGIQTNGTTFPKYSPSCHCRWTELSLVQKDVR